MNADDIDIKDAGGAVTCRMQAKTLLAAHQAHEFADANPPLGYILLRSSIARRKRGGRARFLRLNYVHTGGEKHTPMEHWEEWDETLKAEQDLCRGSKA